MTHAAKHTRSRRTAPPPGSVPPRIPRKGDLGLDALIVAPETPPKPATAAVWISSIRGFARALIWTLPVYACCYGLATLGRLDERDPDRFLTDGHPVQLVGWLSALWLGLAALVAISALLAGTPGGQKAAAGLMLALAGVAVMLPFVSLSQQTSLGGLDARVVVLAGAAVYSLGWVMSGWAVLKCSMLADGDGIVLMIAAPMLGVVGLLVGPLQTVGALLILAAGLGIARRAGRLLPTRGTAV